MIYQFLEIYHDTFKPCKHPEDLWNTAQAALASLGVEHCNYSYSPQNLRGACVKFRSWSSDWDDHYRFNRYHEHDEIAHYCSSGNPSPVYWHDPALNPYRTEQSSAVNGAARQFGINGGLCCPLPVANNLGKGIFNILDVGSGRPFLPECWTARDVQLFGGLLHLRMADLVDGKGADVSNTHPSPLTPREAECLALVSRGKSTKEISDRLQCGDRTTNFHIQNAMRKTGATSRLKAVCAAMDNGWIHP